MTQQVDQREFRNALGRFATGVTIVTTSGENGKPEGLTANSFSAVSLDKPLVLWCLAKSAPTLSIFLFSDNFAINVLSSRQRELSNQFSRPAVDKFSDIEWSAGFGGAPLITDSLAIFECRNARQYEEGDHWILIGEVQQFTYGDDEPLLFAGGNYAVPARHPEDRKSKDEQASPNLTL